MQITKLLRPPLGFPCTEPRVPPLELLLINAYLIILHGFVLSVLRKQNKHRKGWRILNTHVIFYTFCPGFYSNINLEFRIQVS